jgi:tripartite-type tricarboxylate transporter receptor subunit TctC
MAPARTPPEIVTKLNSALRSVLKDPEVQTLIANLGGTVVASTQDEFRQMVANDIERIGRMSKLAGLSPQ